MVSTSTSSVDIDLGELRRAIQQEYAEVALHPEKGFHFHTGQPLAVMLEYQEAWLEGLPKETIESFAGTGNPFSLVNTLLISAAVLASTAVSPHAWSDLPAGSRASI